MGKNVCKDMVKTDLVAINKNSKFPVYVCKDDYFIKVGKNDFVKATFLLNYGYRIRG